MWYPHAVTVAPASEPVSLAEAKDHCRVDGTAEDTLVGGLIAAARGYVESYTGTAIITRTISVSCDSFADFANFPVVPLASVSAISYVDVQGSTQTLASSVYEARADGLAASLALKAGQEWPATLTGSRITVTASVGASAPKPEIKHAILLLVGEWYRSRENTVLGSNQPTELPHAVSALLANHRVFSF